MNKINLLTFKIINDNGLNIAKEIRIEKQLIFLGLSLTY